MTIRVFMSGQSNALGRDEGGPPWSAIDSRVRVWNNVNPLGANGTAFVSAATARAGGTFDNLDRNNLGVWFCHRLAQVRDEDVDFTIVARGATHILEWEPGSPIGMYEEIVDVWTATGQGPADIFLWHQGEGSVSTDPTNLETYRNRWTSFVYDELTAAGVIDANTIIILGGLAEEGVNEEARIAFNIGALQQLAVDTPNTYYAPSDGLTTYDGTHFIGQALYTHGAARYFSAYMEAEGLTMADLFALVNEGGTPGSPGTGANKLYNLLDLALIGMGTKDVTDSPDYTGTLPVDNLLTAGMLAAGAIVEFGTNANGTFVRWESGFQACFFRGAMEYSSATILQYTWTFPAAFVSAPSVTVTPNVLIASNGLNGADRVQCIVNLSGNGSTNRIIRYEGPAAMFVAGDTMGFEAMAIGLWK